MGELFVYLFSPQARLQPAVDSSIGNCRSGAEAHQKGSFCIKKCVFHHRYWQRINRHQFSKVSHRMQNFNFWNTQHFNKNLLKSFMLKFFKANIGQVWEKKMVALVDPCSVCKRTGCVWRCLDATSRSNGNGVLEILPDWSHTVVNFFWANEFQSTWSFKIKQAKF